jgi:hypothetical protein
MFNFEQAILERRRQMAEDGIKSPQLDELESHMREEIARQNQAGADPGAAFELAVQRIGRAVELKTEFTKVAARKHWWQAHLFGTPAQEWKWARVSMIASGWLIAGGMSICLLFRLGSSSGMNGAQQVSGLIAAWLIGAAIVCGKHLHPFLPGTLSTRTRLLAALAGMILMIAEFNILFYAILPRVAFTQSGLLVVILWAMVPWGAFVGIGIGVGEATIRKSRLTPET